MFISYRRKNRTYLQMRIMKQLNFRRYPFLIMHKNEVKKSYLLATIAISGFLLLSVTAAGTQFSHQAFAQGGSAPTNSEQFNNARSSNNNTTSSSGSTGGNASSPSSAAVTPNELPSSRSTSGSSNSSQQSTGASTQNQPPLNKNVVWQGFIASKPSDIPGRKGSSALILAPRNDQGVYSGILTYQASKPVKVVVWNTVNLNNKTAIPKQFGSQEDMIKMGKNTVSLTTLGSSDKSGSIPFTGNAIELVNAGGGKNKDFTATYSVNVVGSQGKMVNNLQSIAAAANATGSNSTGSGK
jgi:hypothetical protein